MRELTLPKLFGVQDKVVVITGGGRGIGKMMADGFVQNGATVYIASRNLKACEATAEELNAKGPGQCFPVRTYCVITLLALRLLTIVWPLTAASEPDESYGSMGAYAARVSVGATAWQKVLSVNVTSPFHLTRYLLPLLDVAATSSDAARVINMGSSAGLAPHSFETIAYDTSKAAVHHMTRVLAAKLARRPNGGHILVNAIAPGIVPSRMSQGITVVTGRGMDDVATDIPIERCGQASDMAGLAIFLASRASGWITGMVIASDGGQVYAVPSNVGAPKL
ncbi:hypothetical protein BBJ28_00017279 [Nothophytophthora sp. Chile5]|nr:hypothetical protein BBJ28_00017279 [Nothophytophthora sp. Chile5]